MDEAEINRLAMEFFYQNTLLPAYHEFSQIGVGNRTRRYVNPVWMREYAWTLVAERVRWFTRA